MLLKPDFVVNDTLLWYFTAFTLFRKFPLTEHFSVLTKRENMKMEKPRKPQEQFDLLIMCSRGEIY